MSEAKHTLGPWEPRNGTTTIYGADGKEVARRIWLGPCDDERSLANARLIAAAPELLHALTMVRDADDDCKRDGLPTIPQTARQTIDSAISKATGGAA